VRPGFNTKGGREEGRRAGRKGEREGGREERKNGRKKGRKLRRDRTNICLVLLVCHTIYIYII
jgi:hypothetical protein